MAFEDTLGGAPFTLSNGTAFKVDQEKKKFLHVHLVNKKGVIELHNCMNTNIA